MLLLGWALAAAVASCAWGAAERAVRAPVVLTAPADAWMGSIGGMLAALPQSGSARPAALKTLAAAGASARGPALAPLIHELTQSLSLTPEAFEALPPAERATALAIAAEQAEQTVTQRTYELVGQAHKLVWSKDTALGHAQRAELYRLADELRNVSLYESAYLPAEANALVAKNAAQAAARWREVRQATVARGASTAAAALAAVPSGEPAAPTMAEVPRSPLSAPIAAENLLKRMKATKSGWGEKDLETLYTGFGFQLREGAKHRRYSHPDFPHLNQTVSRQNELPIGYVQSAIRLIEELRTLSGPTRPEAATHAEVALAPPLAESRADRIAVERPRPPLERAPLPRSLRPLSPRPATQASLPQRPPGVPAVKEATPSLVKPLTVWQKMQAILRRLLSL